MGVVLQMLKNIHGFYKQMILIGYHLKALRSLLHINQVLQDRVIFQIFKNTLKTLYAKKEYILIMVLDGIETFDFSSNFAINTQKKKLIYCNLFNLYFDYSF